MAEEANKQVAGGLVYINPHLSHRFEDALDFAERPHATQIRKGTEIHCIAHLLAVVSLVITHGGD